MGQNGKIGAFKYSTASAHLLSAILTRVTGTSTREFANKFLFTQIGIDSINEYPMSSYGYDDLFGKRVKGWVHDPNNITTGGWGLTLTVREMARFGQLYLNNGFWNGKQIISQDWIAKSTAPNAGASCGDCQSAGQTGKTDLRSFHSRHDQTGYCPGRGCP